MTMAEVEITASTLDTVNTCTAIFTALVLGDGDQVKSLILELNDLDPPQRAAAFRYLSEFSVMLLALFVKDDKEQALKLLQHFGQVNATIQPGDRVEAGPDVVDWMFDDD